MLSFPVLVLDLVISYLKLKDRLSLSLTSKSLLNRIVKLKTILTFCSEKRWVKDGSRLVQEIRCFRVNARGLREGISQIFHVKEQRIYLRKSYTYTNGVLHGRYLSYWTDTYLINKILYYVNGKKHGLYLCHRSSGKISVEKTYDMDKIVTSLYYYPHGSISSKSTLLSDGNRITTTYYPEGHIASIRSSKNGERIIFYRSNPTMVQYSVNYVNGLKDGWEQEFSIDGNLYRKVFYVKGLKQGVEKIFYTESRLHINYVNGKRDGLCIEYKKRSFVIPNLLFGDLILLRCTYVKGKLEGPYKSFHRNGKPKEIRHYLHDQLHGKVIFYNEDGVIQETFSCINGLEEGYHNIYHQGKLIYQDFYKRGKIDPGSKNTYRDNPSHRCYPIREFLEPVLDLSKE